MKLFMTVDEALAEFKRPLVIGDTRQIAARNLLEVVYAARPKIEACENKHHEEVFARGYVAAETTADILAELEDDLVHCACTSEVDTEIIYVLAAYLYKEWSV